MRESAPEAPAAGEQLRGIDHNPDTSISMGMP